MILNVNTADSAETLAVVVFILGVLLVVACAWIFLVHLTYNQIVKEFKISEKVRKIYGTIIGAERIFSRLELAKVISAIKSNNEAYTDLQDDERGYLIYSLRIQYTLLFDRQIRSLRIEAESLPRIRTWVPDYLVLVDVGGTLSIGDDVGDRIRKIWELHIAKLETLDLVDEAFKEIERYPILTGKLINIYRSRSYAIVKASVEFFTSEAHARIEEERFVDAKGCLQQAWGNIKGATLQDVDRDQLYEVIRKEFENTANIVYSKIPEAKENQLSLSMLHFELLVLIRKIPPAAVAEMAQ